MKKHSVYDELAVGALARFLSFSFPKDAEDIARKISSRYLTVTDAMYADRKELSPLVGEGAANMIKLAAAIISRKGTDPIAFGEHYTELELHDYLVSFFFEASAESVHVLLFSDDGAFLGIEPLSTGTVNASEIITRMIIEVARANGVTKLALAHNHPRGISRPSKEDVAVTQTLFEQLSSVGITLLAHYIVASCECVRLGTDEDLSAWYGD